MAFLWLYKLSTFIEVLRETTESEVDIANS
jgi:hypothetical protein